MSLNRSLMAEEENLVFQCINELGLIQLDRCESLQVIPLRPAHFRNDMITSSQMVACCSRLLKAAARIR